MTASHDPDRLLAAYLADGMEVLPDRVVDAVLDEVHRTRQRTVFGPWRTPPMNSALKMALAAAAVVAVVVAGINFLPAGTGGIGGPSASASPVPTLKAVRMTVAGTDPAGATDPVRLTATLPVTWEAGDYAANSFSVDPDGAAFFASTITATFSDPCAHTPRSPNLGSTVAEAATALTEIPDISATDPVQTQLAGHDATLVELSIPASLPCAPEQFLLWTDDPSVDGGWWALAPNESIRVFILDVRGHPVAIATRTYPGTTDATKAELQAAIDSIVFDDPAEPSATPAAVRITVAGTDIGSPGLQLTAALPAGWEPGGLPFNFNSENINAFVSLVDNTFSDPCAHVQRVPKLGPTVADLATALGEIPGTTATDPVQATVGGLAATSIEVTLPASLPCALDQFYYWQDGPNSDWWPQRPEERLRVWIVEAAGQRVAVAARMYPATSEAEKAELQGIVDSITFDTTSLQPSATPVAP